METPRAIDSQLETIAKKPGVYLFKDGSGKLLYIGKAKLLDRRVKSYFQKGAQLDRRKQTMVTEVRSIETILTSSETEALLLEATLIKQEQPPYNVFLKDDKFFLYIRVTLSESFPTVDLVRKIINKKDAYFGPYTSATSVRETVKTLKRIFKFRTCTPGQGKPCFDYSIHRCLGVCVGAISASEYRHVIDQLISFLKGKEEKVLEQLRLEMKSASDKQQFERAARVRDQIAAIEQLMKRQTIVSAKPSSFDVVALAQDKKYGCVALLQIRQGKLIAKQNIIVHNGRGMPDADVMSAFLEQYYAQAQDIPKKNFSDVYPSDASLLERTFGIRIEHPQRGDKRKLTALARENAQNGLENHLASFEKDTQQLKKTLTTIQSLFGLERLPKRIESFDVANIAGQHAVGSMVVFIDGKPEKSLYKKFAIKTIHTIDDPRMLAEVIVRRLTRMATLTRGWERPDLIILDGGKGQLSVVARMAGNLLRHVPLVALAKGGHQKLQEQSMRERFFTLDGKESRLPAPSPELFLLERIRDEAHRFATSFYKMKHERKSTRSLLDEIPGIGVKRRQELLRHFGSVAQIASASEEKIAKIIGGKMARKLKDALSA